MRWVERVAGSNALTGIRSSSVSADVSRRSTSRTTAISTGHARSTACPSRSAAGAAANFAEATPAGTSVATVSLPQLTASSSAPSRRRLLGRAFGSAPPTQSSAGGRRQLMCPTHCLTVRNS